MEPLKIPFTDTASKVLKKAERIARERCCGSVSTEHLLLAFFDVPCLPGMILTQHGITREQTEAKLNEMLGDLALGTAPDDKAAGRSRLEYTPLLEYLILDAQDIALSRNASRIGTEEMFAVILQDIDGIASRVLMEMNLDPVELEDHLLSSMGDDRYTLEEVLAEPPGGPGTGTITQFTRDLTEMAARGRLEPVIGREKELKRMIQILSRRTKNNPCLIGEAGVGKTAVIEALAQRIADGKVPPLLKDKRLVSLNIANVVAGTKYRGEFEERMKNILDEFLAHPEIILFIDEIHTLIGAGGSEGSLDAANILKPALSRGEIQVIGTTTLDEYRKHIEKDGALKRRFQSLLIEEPTEEETLAILQGRKALYEKHHNLSVGEDALGAAVKLSRRYVSDRLWPDKALDLLDEACAAARLNQPEGALTLTAEQVAHTVSLWTGVPLEQLTKEEGLRLTELESVIHERVIGQEEAVSALSKAIRRSRVGLKDPRRPIGSFLFLGPTGVGKTELSKALAVALFGEEKDLIRIDMSEYMEKHSVSKIIGSPPGYVGYDEGGQLSERIRRKPYSVVLFDEIEKAHPDVFHILLQILDEGRLTDSQGRTVDFRNTVIIMTSNAGAERIVEPKALGFSAGASAEADHERMKTQVMEEVKRIFRPEFINRIDEIIVFRMLNKTDIRAILSLQLKDIEKRIRENMSLTLELSEEAAQWFVEKGYQPKYGARPLKRLLQSELEDRLAEAVLKGEIREGDTVLISLKDGAPCLTAGKET
ncbi:MAG: ATP-dependent Clp protease ATP-binding subunit [Lachnospiraceae bacterium]|nr:ATP-dependent Clp protease ATP-binding subunit [Lachnospiraceae bacterium]